MARTINEIIMMHPDTTPEQWHQHENGGGWVYHAAKVEDRVNIGGGAVISGGEISGSARISGGEISGGEISGSARISGGVISGSARISGGEISGGEISGGEISGSARISGGVISGGVIYGGVIYGGEISGGEISGGVIYGSARIYGGEISGGVIYGSARISGGVISGGVISGGVIYGSARISGGVIYGGTWAVSPLFIQGTRFSLNNSAPGFIAVGCQNRTFAWWQKNGELLGKREGFTPAEIEEYRRHIEYIIANGVPAPAVEATPCPFEEVPTDES